MFFIFEEKKTVHDLFTGRGYQFYICLYVSLLYLCECRKRSHYQLFYYFTQKHIFVLTEVKIKV